jgi:hypothetical protein
MSENVSSSVLFHFTGAMKNLVSILTDGFFPHYCPEYTLDAIDREAASKHMPPTQAAPLVCFCDLPLSLIWSHLEEYGHYGIGLDKKWGLKMGVTPVFYTHAMAQTRPPISRLTAAANKSNDATTLDDMRLLAAYTKPFRGPAWRNDSVKTVVFYDEREWRYVPIVDAGDALFLGRADYTNVPKLRALHWKFKRKHVLRVSPDDIQYLIVPDDSHILRLVERLQKLYNSRDATLVTTAIMTSDRIEADI